MTGLPYDPSVMLFSLVSILGLLVLYFWLYRDYRIDLFRQRLFALRDELFDLARSGALPFDHRAYGLLRSTLNGFIRFGHRLTFIPVALLAAEYNAGRLKEAGIPSFQVQWDEATQGLDPRLRERLESMISQMHFLVVEQLIFTSTALTLLIVPTVCLILMERGRQSLVQKVRRLKVWKQIRSRLLEPIDSAALAEGMDASVALSTTPLRPGLAT